MILNGRRQMQTKSVYLAAGWFNEQQKQMMNQAIENLKKNETVGYTYIPLENQYKNIADENDPLFGTYEWANETFNSDIKAMQNSDVGVFLVTSEEVDSGTAFELGYFKANNKPTLVFVSDKKIPLNLMVAKGGTSYINTLDDLAAFDFDKFPLNFYTGEIF